MDAKTPTMLQIYLAEVEAQIGDGPDAVALKQIIGGAVASLAGSLTTTLIHGLSSGTQNPEDTLNDLDEILEQAMLDVEAFCPAVKTLARTS